EQERLAAAHKERISLHDVEARTDVRREVSLVDDQDVRLSDPRPVLAWDLVTRSNVNHVDKIIHQRRRESQREIVAAALDQYDVAVGEARLHLFDCGKIHTRVLAHCRVRAGAGLNPEDPLLNQNALERSLHLLCILRGHDIVGYDEYLYAEIEQSRRDGLHDCRLSRTYRPAHPNTHDFLFRHRISNQVNS